MPSASNSMTAITWPTNVLMSGSKLNWVIVIWRMILSLYRATYQVALQQTQEVASRARETLRAGGQQGPALEHAIAPPFERVHRVGSKQQLQLVPDGPPR